MAPPPPRGPHQVSKGPQEKDGKLGHHNIVCVRPTKLHCGNKIFQIWHLIKSSLLPCTIHSTEGEDVFYCFPHILSSSIWFQLSDLFAVKCRLLSWCCEEWQYSLITDHTATRHSKACKRLIRPKEHTEYHANYYQNIFTFTSKQCVIPKQSI
jgi:hypothetical protein